MYSIAAFADKIIMSDEAIKRYKKTKNKGPAELRQHENPAPPPEPIYGNAIDNNSGKMIPTGSDAVKANDATSATGQSEPILTTVQNEKMDHLL